MEKRLLIIILSCLPTISLWATNTKYFEKARQKSMSEKKKEEKNDEKL